MQKRQSINPRQSCSASLTGTRRISLSTTNMYNEALPKRRSLFLTRDSKGTVKLSKLTVRVYDDNGIDVTPQPLYYPDATSSQEKCSNILMHEDISVATFSDLLSSRDQTTQATFSLPFTRSSFEKSSKSIVSMLESMHDETQDPSSRQGISHSIIDDTIKKEEVSEDMLEGVVDKFLTETETIWLLDIPSTSVSVFSEEAAEFRERTTSATEFFESRLKKDKYSDRAMQTLNLDLKTKHMQCEDIPVADAGVQVTTWDMYDTYIGNVANEMKPADKDMSAPEYQLPTEGTVPIVNLPSSEGASSSQKKTGALPPATGAEPDISHMFESESFQRNLLFMERSVLQNIFQPKLAMYRNLTVLEDPFSTHKKPVKKKPKVEGEEKKENEEKQQEQNKASAAGLENLWFFSSNQTTGHNISCMTWNKKNQDILAVGYGPFDFKTRVAGLVTCWSLKNITWPERIFPCQSGVTTLDFSASNPSHLAVGMQDGSVAIYDVQSKAKTPVADCDNCTNKHTQPVWQVWWASQENGHSDEEKGDTLISVAGDGRVCKWFLRNGLDCFDILELKKAVPLKTVKKIGQKEQRIVSLMSQNTPGLCFAFHPKDSNIYLAGTEEGHIYKCSRLYSEQYLETYSAHRGAVYKIAWSPFCDDIFLSCSTDWNVLLWKQGLFTPVLTFSSTKKAVFDVKWSPKWATVFGAIKEDRVEIWELGETIMDPVIVFRASPGVKFTSLLFASEADCVLVGDSNGEVGVYKISIMASTEALQVDTLEHIIRSTLISRPRLE